MNAIACIIITNDFKENKFFCCYSFYQFQQWTDVVQWLIKGGFLEINAFEWRVMVWTSLSWFGNTTLPFCHAVKRKFWKLRSSLQKLKDVSMIWYTSMYYLYDRWLFSICGTALHSSFMPTKMHQMQLISIIYLSNITQWFWI